MDSKPTTLSSPAALTALGVFFAAFIVAYFDSLVTLFGIWSSAEITTNRYGFLVLASTIYLLFLKREKIRQTPIEPSWWGLLPTLMFTSIWFVATLASVQAIQLATLPLLLLGAIWSTLGINHLRLFFLPVVILLFAIPMWTPLIPLLKDITTLASESILRLVGRPIFVEGYYLFLPGGTFLVDDSCAGLRFLLVGFLLGTISIDLYELPLRRAIIQLLFITLLAIVANWIRVVIVVLVGDYTQMQHPFVEDHNNLGWVVYVIIVLIPYFFLIRYLTARDTVPRGNSTASGPDLRGGKSKIVAVACICLLILTSGPGLASVLRGQDFAPMEIALPTEPNGWTLDNTTNTDSGWQPAYRNAERMYYGEYVNGSDRVELHVFHYPDQLNGAEVINVENEIAAGRWRELPGTQATQTVETQTGTPLAISSADIANVVGGTERVWYWFEIGAMQTNRATTAKVYQLLAMLQGRNDANLVALAAACAATCQAADEALYDFLTEVYPALRAAIGNQD